MEWFKKYWLLILLALIAGGFILNATVFKPYPDMDCGDFHNRDEAQEWFEQDPTDNEDMLDADADGRVCETYEYGEFEAL